MKKIRVIEHPSGRQWIVQVRGLFFEWVGVYWYHDIDAIRTGKTAKELAIEYAERLKNPEVIEI
jgi:hypothetical protein